MPKNRALKKAGNNYKKKGNIFIKCPQAASSEYFHPIAETRSAKIERIVSHGQSTPKGVWLRQGFDEWVMLLRGRARLVFKPNKKINLKAGDYLFIPRNIFHRVDWTMPERATIWLAVHLK